MTENHDEVRNVLLLKIAICGYYDVTKIDMFVWLDFTTTYHMAMMQKAIFVQINDLMPVISCSTSLTFWSLFHVISIPFCSKARLGPMFVKK